MKKKLFALILTIVFSILIMSAVVASATGNITMYVYTANGKALNLRSAPNTSAEVLAGIPYGASVRVYAAYNDAWYSVGYNNITGYVMSRFLVSTPPAPQPSPTPTPPDDNTLSNAMFNGFYSTNYTVQVRPTSPTGYVNLRWAPSLNADIYSRYYMGNLLTVIADNGTWSQVMDESNRIVGFMMSSFLVNYSGDGSTSQGGN